LLLSLLISFLEVDGSLNIGEHRFLELYKVHHTVQDVYCVSVLFLELLCIYLELFVEDLDVFIGITILGLEFCLHEFLHDLHILLVDWGVFQFVLVLRVELSVVLVVEITLVLYEFRLHDHLTDRLEDIFAFLGRLHLIII
jgi:hypothetical protein